MKPPHGCTLQTQSPEQRRGYYNTHYTNARPQWEKFQEELKAGVEGGPEVENFSWGIRKGFSEEVVFERWVGNTEFFG